MGLPDIGQILSNLTTTVEDYGSKYWIYAIIGTVGLIGYIIWTSVT